MNYERIVREVEGLGFLRSREQAEEGVRVCLALIISRLSRKQAEQLLDFLPVPYTYGELHAYGRTGIASNTVREDIADIALQMRINFDQAHALMNCVIHAVKASIGQENLREIEQLLPPDWVAAFEAS